MLETKEVSKKSVPKVTIHIIIRERITFDVKSSSVERSIRTAVACKTEEPVFKIESS